MGADNAIEDFQYVLWDAVCFSDKLIILDETIIIASNKTDGL